MEIIAPTGQQSALSFDPSTGSGAASEAVGAIVGHRPEGMWPK
ncbi:MAG: hypothetical protein ACPGWR_18355 [Ardenticatenaceae bacterium]